MILGWSSFKIVQMVLVHCISRSQELKIDFLTKNLKNLLVRNHWTDFNIILQKCSFGDPLPRLFKPFGFVKKHSLQGVGLIFLYIYTENFKNLLVRNHWTDFSIILQKCSLGDPLPRMFQPFGFIKKHGCQGVGGGGGAVGGRGVRGLFSLYIYIENFKNLLVRNHWTNFNIILQKCSLVILYQDCSSHLDSAKNMAARGMGLISLYIYIENFKNLLVRNHWTDYNIILQKCSFADSLPRLFKPFGFLKKKWPPGGGTYFPYLYLYSIVRAIWIR